MCAMMVPMFEGLLWLRSWINNRAGSGCSLCACVRECAEEVCTVSEIRVHVVRDVYIY